MCSVYLTAWTSDISHLRLQVTSSSEGVNSVDYLNQDSRQSQVEEEADFNLECNGGR